MSPVRVLYVSGGSLDRGGISSWMLNFASRFDRERVAVDFLVHGMEPGDREDEAISLGAKVYHIPYRRSDPVKNRRGMVKAVSAGYDIVHSHMEGMNAYSLGIAAGCGVPVRISHAHSTDFLTTSLLHRYLNEIGRRRISKAATHFLACSERAATFLYGRALLDSGNVKIVRNAIDLTQFRFSEADRGRIRKELDLDGRFAIGNVGRLETRIKNQRFLLDAFQAARTKRPNLALVLVGDGPDRSELEKAVSDAGLGDDVRFTGERRDVAALMSAFDLFAMPSMFEGLGIALVEAQANGLPCIASENVPREAGVVNCEYIPLSSAKDWADALAQTEAAESRGVNETDFYRMGYDIRQAAGALERFYLEVAK